MAESETEISKEELQKEIAVILDKASLENTSTKKVIQKLEKKLGMTLTHKKKLIDQLVMDYVNSMDSDEDSDEEEPEVIPKKKAKKKKNNDDDEEDDDINDSDKKSEKKKVEEKKKKSPSKPKKKPEEEKGVVGKRKKPSGYTKTLKLSPELAELVGDSELPRHEVVKRIWTRIREKQLFDPKNRHYAMCDKALYKVFGKESFPTFKMLKYLKIHFLE